MKKLLIITFLLLIVFSAGAKTIHWITFVDTTDPNVGTLDVNGHKVLYDNFVNEVNAALAENGYKSDVQNFIGYQVSPTNCTSVVKNLKVQDPNDIIVFYYIGHGGRPNSGPGLIENNPFPWLYLAQSDGNKCVSLEWIYKNLKDKGARLTVTIGMACNVLDNDITIKSGPTFSVNYGVSKMSNNKLKHIQELFLNAKGSVIATSSLPTQSSIGANTIFGPMDFYTAAICQVFKNELSSWSGNFTWNSFLDRVERLVSATSDGQQTPFYQAHLSTSPTPTKTPPTATPIKPTRDINVLTNKLTELANSSINEETRISLEQSMNSLFTNNAVVRILSQDGNTVVDKEDYDVFLGRLSTSRLLLKVTVIDGEFDSNNRITQLRVKETYRN